MKWLASLVLAIALLLTPAVLSAESKYSKHSPQYISIVLDQAKKLIGVRYRWGGDLRWSSRTDCSGFTQYVYRSFGIELPRSSRGQANVGQTVCHGNAYSVMRPGDLIFFRYRGRIRHVGIYLGNYLMLHCSSARHVGVTITDLRDYWLPIHLVKRLF